MKIIALVLAIVVLVPGLAMACTCCAPAPHESALQISAAACHCCPDVSEINRDAGKTEQKQAFLISDTAALSYAAPLRLIQTVEENSAALQASPPGTPAFSPLVLRI